MKFNIKDISPDGRSVSRKFDPSEVVQLLAPSELDLLDRPCELEVDLLMTRCGDAVTVQGSARGVFWLSCGRCLGPCRVDLDEPSMHLTYLPPPSEMDQDQELEPDDLDTATHDGVEVDLEPLLREQLVLVIPIQLFCRPECKGICPDCGKDLNTETCGCGDERAEQEEQLETSPWKRAMMQLKEETGGSKQ